MKRKKSIEDLDLKGKKVLMRVDFNVPLDEAGEITDDTRIRSALRSVRYALDKGGAVILMSHLGRPKGKIVGTLRMDEVAARLAELLGQPVKKLNDCVGTEVESAAAQLKPGEVILLENLRFHPEEKSGDEGFAERLAALADLYVSDAFGTVHRADASMVAVPKQMKQKAAGFLLLKEIEYLSKAVASPEHPYVAMLGGAKVSDKIPVIENLIGRVDALLIGGGMAYTFLKAQGKSIGNSKLEEDKVDLASSLLKLAADKGTELLLPVDHVAARELADDAETEIQTEVAEGYIGADIGPATIDLFNSRLKDAKMVVWNGPLGVFEKKPFTEGTRRIAETLAGLEAITIIGGGETAAAVQQFGLTEKMSHVSTGGGASLEFLEGKALPGIEVLDDAE